MYNLEESESYLRDSIYHHCFFSPTSLQLCGKSVMSKKKPVDSISFSSITRSVFGCSWSVCRENYPCFRFRKIKKKKKSEVERKYSAWPDSFLISVQLFSHRRIKGGSKINVYFWRYLFPFFFSLFSGVDKVEQTKKKKKKKIFCC